MLIFNSLGKARTEKVPKYLAKHPTLHFTCATKFLYGLPKLPKPMWWGFDLLRLRYWRIVVSCQCTYAFIVFYCLLNYKAGELH